jgi:hypothetical protein
MLKGLLLCTLACGAASPAAAGDKSAPTLASGAKAIAVPKERISYGARKISPVIPATTLPGRPVAFALPAGAAMLKTAGTVQLLAGERLGTNSRYTMPQTGATSWDAPATPVQATADAGASYAVNEALHDRYKPRQRRSTIRTVLSLHLDGQEESPAFSVGGSAVTAAVWRAMPR